MNYNAIIIENIEDKKPIFFYFYIHQTIPYIQGKNSIEK